MALLKAFVCQVVLFGLYKLFLEEVVEAHLVPDELTRNCLVGFVCLVCFGMQLYTDKADEDNAEADENPKAKSESRGAKSAETSEPSKISTTQKTVGSNASSQATGIFVQFSPNMSDTIPNVKANGTGIPAMPASTIKTSFNLETTSSPVLNGFSETNVCEESDDDGIQIDQFVAKKLDKEVEQLKTVEAKDTKPTECEEAMNIRAEVEVIKPQDVSEEAKQSTVVQPEEVEQVKGEDVVTGEAEQLESVEVEDVKVIESEDVLEEVSQSRTDAFEAIKPEVAVVESKCLITNGEVEEVKSTKVEPEEVELIKGEDVTREAEDVEVIKSENAINEVNQSRIDEDELIKPEEVTEAVVESTCLIDNGQEVEVIKPEGETEEVRQSKTIEDEVGATETEEKSEAVVESECLLADGEDITSIQDSGANTNMNSCESSEAQMTNGITEKCLNNIDSVPLNIIEEIKSKKSVMDEGGQETPLPSQADECTNDIKESLPSPQEISNVISISTKVVNNLEIENKHNAETTTLMTTTVSSPSEKLTVSTSRQKATVAADVCVAPITIDISFIYACH